MGKSQSKALAGEAADAEPVTGAVLMPSDDLAGQDKYLGGALGPDGVVYGVPGSARRVLKVVPATGEVSFIGPDMPGKVPPPPCSP